jgi:hypothetical protein
MSLGLGVAGIQNTADGGLGNVIRLGQQADQIVSELHGRYYEQTVRGKVFSVNTQGTAVTTTAALAVTWTGLGIANAASSGVNLVLLAFSATQFAVGAASTIGILGGTGVLAASLTVQNRLIGSGTAANTGVTASAGATISTPLLIQTYGSVGSLATTTYGLENGIYVDVGGSIVVPPGSFIGTYTSIVTTSALNFGFVWEEVPIIR